MAISRESKQALRVERERLDGLRSNLQKEIDKLDNDRASLVSRRQELTNAIASIKADIDNG